MKREHTHSSQQRNDPVLHSHRECENFQLHYVCVDGKYIASGYGHCMLPRKLDGVACEHWEEHGATDVKNTVHPTSEPVESQEDDGKDDSDRERVMEIWEETHHFENTQSTNRKEKWEWPLSAV